MMKCCCKILYTRLHRAEKQISYSYLWLDYKLLTDKRPILVAAPMKRLNSSGSPKKKKIQEFFKLIFLF